MCLVFGNISNNVISLSSYFSFNRFKSLAKVIGSQDTYTIFLELLSNNVLIVFLSKPLRGGSTTTTSLEILIISLAPLH